MVEDSAVERRRHEPVGRWYRLIDNALEELESYALLEAGIDEDDDDLGEEEGPIV